jgi:hypothetical protein
MKRELVHRHSFMAESPEGEDGFSAEYIIEGFYNTLL